MNFPIVRSNVKATSLSKSSSLSVSSPWQIYGSAPVRHFLPEELNAHVIKAKTIPFLLNAASSFDGSTDLSAYDLFDRIPDLDVVSATYRIGQFVSQRHYKYAIHLFCKMLSSNIRPSEYTFGTVIPGSTALGDFRLGRGFHGCVMRMGYSSSVFVGSTVIDVYVKLGSIEEARRALEDIKNPNVVSHTTLLNGYLKKGMVEDAICLFEKMPERNTVSWNSMICGYSQMGFNEESVNLFVKMMRTGLWPNESTFPSAIIAAANIASLGLGRGLHACVLKLLTSFNAFVSNSLISFYSKCGSMEDALQVFDKMSERDVISYNAMICGFAQNGKGTDAITVYENMKTTATVRPNSVTLLGLLWACNHAGLVDTGYLYFDRAKCEHPELLAPNHYACFVDLLSRCGRFNEAMEFLERLPFDPGIGFWKALLGGCHVHSNVELGELAANKILELDPTDASSYVMLSNTHSAAARWQNVAMVRKEMKEKGMKRITGCSWIEIRSQVRVFVSGAGGARRDAISSILNFFIEHLREMQTSRFLVEY